MPLNRSSLGTLATFYLVVYFVYNASSLKARSVSDSLLSLLQFLVEQMFCDLVE